MAKNERQSLLKLLSAEVICVDAVLQDKADAIEQLVQLVATQPQVEDVDELRKAIFKREATMSTGVGAGIALPHAKTDATSRMVASLCIAKQPLAFDAFDQQPVRILLLLVAPIDDALQHIRLLGHISRMMSRPAFCARLLETQDATAVLRVVEEEENRNYYP